jgi:hypothetical protein
MKSRKTVAAIGALSAALMWVTNANADSASVARQAVDNVVRNVVENVRDRVQQRLAVPLPGVTPLGFNDDGTYSSKLYDSPLGPLAYDAMPTKARPFTKAAIAPPSAWLYGASLNGSYDWNRSSSAGTSTNSSSWTLSGGADVTKIGVFDTNDALSFIVTGSETWTHADGLRSTTPGVALTLAYIKGGFSTDATVGGLWTHSRTTSGGIDTSSTTKTWDFTNNYQYKFDLAGHAWIEPTVGYTYAHSNSDALTGATGPVVIGGIVIPGTAGTATGAVSSWEVHGGARIGTELTWNGVRVHPSLEGIAFSPVYISVSGDPTEHKLGGRGSAKLAFDWTQSLSSYVEAHLSGIDGTSGYGATAGLRLTW